MSTDDPTSGRRVDAASVFASLQLKLAYFESPQANPLLHSRGFAHHLCLEMEIVALRISAFMRAEPRQQEAALALKERLNTVHKRARRRRDDLDH